jgi:hypothetical protein
VVFESCQYLEIPRSNIPWFHPDFQEQIDRLYLENSVADRQIQFLEVAELLLGQSAPLEQHLPTKIDCFQHVLRIYTRLKFPLYWAMLQHNLGLAYFDRIEGDRLHNLKRSIECFNKSLEIYTQNEFPEKWKSNQDDLKESQKSIALSNKQRLIKNIFNRKGFRQRLTLVDVDLSGANLSDSNLSGADLSGANLRRVNLSAANLSSANLSDANLGSANLVDANLSSANVRHARFEFTSGVPESLKQDLIARGAIFDDTSSRNLVPR